MRIWLHIRIWAYGCISVYGQVVLSRWADHLLAAGDHQRALEIQLSLGRVQEVSK